MSKLTIEKIETIQDQEKDFRSCVRHLKYLCKVYLANNISQKTLILMIEICLLKMKYFSDKTFEKLFEKINGNGKTGKIHRENPGNLAAKMYDKAHQWKKSANQ
jgi:hypothetical protein